MCSQRKIKEEELIDDDINRIEAQRDPCWESQRQIIIEDQEGVSPTYSKNDAAHGSILAPKMKGIPKTGKRYTVTY